MNMEKLLEFFNEHYVLAFCFIVSSLMVLNGVFVWTMNLMEELFLTIRILCRGYDPNEELNTMKETLEDLLNRSDELQDRAEEILNKAE